MAVHMEQLSVSQSVAHVAVLLGSRWALFAKLSAAAVLPLVLLTGLFEGISVAMFEDLIHKLQKDVENNDLFALLQDLINGVTDSIAEILMFMLVYLAIYIVIAVAGKSAMIRTAAELYVESNRRDSGDWWDRVCRGLRHFWALSGASALFAIILIFIYYFPIFLALSFGKSSFGEFLFITSCAMFPFVMIYLSVRLLLIYPVIVVENTSALQGFKRSWLLTRGAFCEVWCTSLPLAILQMLFFLGLYILAKKGVNDVFFSLLLLPVSSLVFWPCFAILQTVLYMNNRVRTEGLTKEALARDLLLTDEENESAMPLLLGESSDAVDNGVTQPEIIVEEHEAESAQV